MAQSKRRRAEPESADDDSGSEGPSQASRLQNKRSRRTPMTPGSDDSTQDDVDLNGVYTYQYTAPKHDASMAIEIFSSDEDEDEEDEAEDLRASEAVKESMTRTHENRPSDSGIIEEVSMKNFMCHSRLTIPLGPLINFIIGHNGSGKSAILTALTVCLGGKATVTNRGKKLADFIKEGEDDAWVSVMIKNQGENTYQPDIYGESIIIERHFSRTGSSSFKIKNAEGRIISTKKSDMENISDFFALQIDNPLNVLSQDMARQFLSNSTPHDKYKFFIRGTQLEQLDRDYALMEQYLDECEAKNEARQNDVAVLGEKKRKAEAKKRTIDRTDTIQTQINELGWQHAWAQIEEQERNVAQIDQKIARRQEEIERQQLAADNASHIFNEEDTDHGLNQGVIEDLERELQPKKDSYQEIKERFDRNKAALTEHVAVQRTIKSDMATHRASIQSKREKIAAEHDRIENANGPAHAQKVAELEEVRASVPEHEERLQQHRATKPQLERAVGQAQNDLNAFVEGPVRRQEGLLDDAQRGLGRLEADRGDRSKAFHPSVSNVVRAIQNEQRWREKPVGPMGNHITLKNPKWSSVLETTIGNNLDAFVVTNKQDQALLSGMMKRMNCNSNILIGSSRHIDVSQNEPEPNVDTILRIVDIDNDLVRNALIINQRIEQTVLIPTREDGNRYAQADHRNVFAVMTHQDVNNPGMGWRFDKTRSGGNRMSPVQRFPPNRTSRMKTNIEDMIRIQRSDIAQMTRDLDQLQTQKRAKEVALKDAKAAVTRHTQEARRLQEAVQRATVRVEDLDKELEADNVNDTGVLEELQQQLKDAENEYETAKQSYEDSVLQKDMVDEAQRTDKSELDAATRAVDELQAKIGKAQTRKDRKEQARAEALRKKNREIGLLDEAIQRKAEAVQERDDLAHQIETELIPQAEDVHSRVPVPPNTSVQQLDAKLTALINEKQRVENSAGGSREQIYAAYEIASNEFRKGNNDLNSMIYSAKLIKQSLLHRKGRWRKFRRMITSRAQINFIYLLAERGFRGRVLANHSDKMLDIAVEPDTTRESDAGRQTKTLSGGEKSFSTICLLLSIWEAMGSPIRCLDEFDVFMDHANRDISMKMMVQAARRSAGRQYILITPQAMTAVEGWHDVKIFKMSDPERGQGTLPFGEGS